MSKLKRGKNPGRKRWEYKKGPKNVSFILTLIDPRTPTHHAGAARHTGHATFQGLSQLAQSRKDEDFFDDMPGGAFLLGNDGVLYDQVRLVELYTKDGMTWRPEFALNAHFLSA
ncbi:hypothetical protein C8R44DRAFT_731436 [Mycena epipterygia]|nr:hypothetical protein C8R44DRAFT_731436 [Mycena epipterygia]